MIADDCGAAGGSYQGVFRNPLADPYLLGVAAGAGLSIALACDLRIAASDAFLVTAFVNIGLSGDYGASWFLNRLVGRFSAAENQERPCLLDVADERSHEGWGREHLDHHGA